MNLRFMLAPPLLAVFMASASDPSRAVDTDPSPPLSAEHAAGKKAIEDKDWNRAIQALTVAAQRDGRNADIQNLLGYAYRNAGQLEAAFKHYQQALKLEPRHLGAHEYIGEAYLIANNPVKAEEHLALLKQYCTTAVCEEFDDLKKKLDQYRARGR
ncbi:MAG TPA: tetratricopeptide repeat protein [Burkholderiales bacterium]|nr:tetratricopeptide repeat protein [Burkholderiales bacterium]